MLITNYTFGKDNGPMPPCVASIGFFDGVHLGHRHLIEGMVSVAKAEGVSSEVITFDRHPRQVLQQEFRPRLLTTAGEKLALLSRTGVDRCTVLHFDRCMASLSAREFMQSVLKDRLNVRTLIIGYDNRFGHNRAEGFEDYAGYGVELGIRVVRADALIYKGISVSSSAIRTLLAEGRADMARSCLGYPYFISGGVVSGFREGRKMGFPTANIKIDDGDKLIPAHGVYAVKVSLEVGGKTFNGMMNIGTRPTFGGESVTLEVNIFDFSGNLYGHNVTVMFYSRLRDERKFRSVSQLEEQLKADREAAVSLLETVDEDEPPVSQ